MSREKHLKRLIGCWKPETHEQELRLVAVRGYSSGVKIDHLEVSGKTGKVFFLLNDNGTWLYLKFYLTIVYGGIFETCFLL